MIWIAAPLYASIAFQKGALGGPVTIENVKYTVSVTDGYENQPLKKFSVTTKTGSPCQVSTKVELKDNTYQPLFVVMTPSLNKDKRLWCAFSETLGDSVEFGWSREIRVNERMAVLFEAKKPGKRDHWQLAKNETPTLKHGQYLIEIWAEPANDSSVTQNNGSWDPLILPGPYTHRTYICSVDLKGANGTSLSQQHSQVIEKCACWATFFNIPGKELKMQIIPRDGVELLYKEALITPGQVGTPKNVGTAKLGSKGPVRFALDASTDSLRLLGADETPDLKAGEYVIEVTLN